MKQRPTSRDKNIQINDPDTSRSWQRPTSNQHKNLPGQLPALGQRIYGVEAPDGGGRGGQRRYLTTSRPHSGRNDTMAIAAEIMGPHGGGGLGSSARTG
jgi:hypothetical protein